jgi:hypothetical protein
VTCRSRQEGRQLGEEGRKESLRQEGKEVEAILTVGATDGNFSQQELDEFAECPGHRDEGRTTAGFINGMEKLPVPLFLTTLSCERTFFFGKKRAVRVSNA